MSERQREDDDAAWLRARENGQSAPASSETSAARHDKLEALLADLPPAAAGASGQAWQARVLAAIDDEDAARSPPRGASVRAARTWVRWLVAILAIIGAAAVAGTLWCYGASL